MALGCPPTQKFSNPKQASMKKWGCLFTRQHNPTKAAMEDNLHMGTHRSPRPPNVILNNS